MLHWMRTRSTIAFGALLALLSCSSPLDVPTKRIDTQLTNRIKVRSVEVNATIERPADSLIIDQWPYDSLTIGDWPHTVTSPLFNADTIGSPPHIWMNYQMRGTGKSWLKEINLKLDDVKSEGAVTLATGPGAGSRVTATVAVGNREYTTTTSDNASGTFYYRHGEKESIQGTIVIGMDRSPSFSILIAINFTATQD